MNIFKKIAAVSGVTAIVSGFVSLGTFIRYEVDKTKVGQKLAQLDNNFLNYPPNLPVLKNIAEKSGMVAGASTGLMIGAFLAGAELDRRRRNQAIGNHGAQNDAGRNGADADAPNDAEAARNHEDNEARQNPNANDAVVELGRILNEDNEGQRQEGRQQQEARPQAVRM